MDEYCTHMKKFGGFNCMVWGGIWYDGITDLYVKDY